MASLVADAMRYVTGAEVALINSGNIRGALYRTDVNNGYITRQDINEIAPFPQHLYKFEVTEKELVNTLNIAAESFKSSNPIPGLLQVSGINYKISNNGTLQEACLIRDDGTIENLNIDKPSLTKKISVVCSDFLIRGGDGFTTLKRNAEEIKAKSINNPEAPEGYFSVSKADATDEYLRHNFAIRDKKIYVPEKTPRIMVEKD